jgi:hypothetical protein
MVVIKLETNSRDTSVGIATGCGLHGWGLIPGRSKTFSIPHNFQIGYWATQPLIHWILEAFSSVVNRQMREAIHSHDQCGGEILPLHHTPWWCGV